MKRKRKWMKYSVFGILTIILTGTFLWMFNQGNEVRAAGGIIIGGDDGSGEYRIRQRDVVASIDGVPASATVKWITSDPEAVQFKDSPGNASYDTGSVVQLRAVGLSSAPVIITATYEHEGTTFTFFREVSVPTAIAETSDAHFGKIRSDMESVIILNLGDSGKVSLLYDLPSDVSVRWESRNPYIVAMDANNFSAYNSSGEFWAVGTGKTQIVVSYENTATGKQVTSSVDVYVGPKVDVDGAAPDSNGNSIAKRHSNINLGADMTDNNETINNKVEWFLTDEQNKVLQKSTDGGSQYLSSSMYASYLTVTAKAGTYQLYVFTAGVYEGIGDLTDASISTKLKKVITLKVIPEPDAVEKVGDITLQVQDSYNFAEVMNITPEKFNDFFQVTYDNGAELGSVSSGAYTANNLEGTATITIKLSGPGQAEVDKFFNGVIDRNFSHTINIHIYKGFYLDRSDVSIYVGGSLQLNTIYGGNKGVITWKSSNPNQVSVSNNGLITGRASTGSNSVTITASMVLPDGRTLTANCSVRVSVTATKIKLNKTSLQMQTGDTSTVVASFEPSTVTTANLQWLVTNSNVADVSVTSDTSVLITAKDAGTTILTAVNADNYVAAYCTITVLAPIQNITISETSKTMTLSQEVLKLRATWQPTNATAIDLEWSSSNTAVATVDSTGLVTFKAPGTCLITVKPIWNPYNVMAQCHLTIIASPTAFALDKTAITLEVGEKATIAPVLTAANSTTTITWKSMDTKIASVNNGVVTAAAPGQVYIIASTKEGFVASCLVTVTQKATGIALDVYTINIAVGETYTVKATANPATSTEKTFTWTSKDVKIASVKDGAVTGVTAGSTTIHVKSKSGEVVYLYVTVYDKAKGMTLNYANKELAKGSTFKLTPIFTPTNVTNRKVTFKSLNTKVATVNSSGTVKGVNGGVAIITAVAEDGNYMATCLVTVVEPVSNIKLNHTSYALGLGKSITLKATVTSNTASNPKIKWTSSNSSVATVNSGGKVTGKKMGSATITATVTDGSKKKATCKITVVRQVTSISMNKPILTLMVGQTQKLKANIKPSNATYKTAKWSSSDSSVAIVDSVGNVTGLSVGTATIKAAARDNSKKAVTCYVYVIDPVPASGIVLSAKDIVLINGQSDMISYTITPANSTDKITFSSDNKAIVTVSGTGKITARRTGNATITLTATSGKQAVVNVRVIGLNKTKLTLEQYDTETLIVEGVTSPVTWYSGNPSIATVSGGKVVARKKGTTTIYAKVNGITLSCQVTVKNIK